MIYTHGLDLLSSLPTPFLKHQASYLLLLTCCYGNIIMPLWLFFLQVAFSYGYGSGSAWSIIPNVVYVPNALFNIDEDITQ